MSEKGYIRSLSEKKLTRELERTLHAIEEYNENINQSEGRLRLIENEITRRAVEKINQAGDVKVTYIDRPRVNTKKNKK